uniref:Uncharacterized protein n=1 Tax=Zooxanthella nutricula TaxID=1333877 RepID=A0A7S2Q0S4_9DINO
MEPAAALLATGAMAFYAARRVEKMSRRRAMESSTLYDTLFDGTVEDHTALAVVAVHLRSARLARHSAGARLRACVKYGRPGNSVKCVADEMTGTARESPKAVARAFVGRKPRVAEAVDADFSQTCLFLAERDCAPVVRLRLVEVGGRREFARAEVDIPPPGVRQQSIDLFGVGPNSAQILGHFDVSVETRIVTKGSLQRCLGALCAKKNESAIVFKLDTLSCGTIVEPGLEDVDVIQGEAVSPVDVCAGGAADAVVASGGRVEGIW